MKSANRSSGESERSGEIFRELGALTQQVKYDNLLKTIFFDAMPALLRLLKCAPVVEYLSVEFPRRHKMVADVVALLADGRILHLEFQVKNDPDMHWRCCHYFGVISQRWREAEIIQVVVYLGDEPLTMESSIAKPSCQFRYDILNMQEVPARIFLRSPRDAERVLAVVAKARDPRVTIRRILASWKGLPENELRENIERLRTLSQLRKNEIMTVEEVARMPFELDVTESEIYKMGQVQGNLQGKVEGKVEGQVELLSRLLAKRFGPLSRTYTKKLSHAGLADLERWTDRYATAQSLREVFQ